MRARLLVCATAAVTPLVALPLWAPVSAGPKDKAVALSPIGTYATGVIGASAAEVTAHDPATQRLFVVNAQVGQVDVLDVRDPSVPTKVGSLSAAGLTDVNGTVIGAGASINSVDVRGGLLAVAVQAPVKTDLGWLAVYRAVDLSPLGAVRVGAQPDMTVFADHDTVLVANEGEPNDKDEPLGDPGFTRDPEGSVSLVDLTGGLSQDAVRTARFTAFEGVALPAGVRVFGPDVPVPAGQQPAGRVARNLEPEYIAVDQQAKTAYVTLQEASAVAVLDLRAGEFTALRALPTKNWNAPGNVLDASDRDSAVRLRNWPVTGLAMPDAIASYQVKGETYLVTANEGDAREWGGYVEPARVNSLALCADQFSDAASLKANANLGRLNVSTASGFDPVAGCYRELFAFGARSFSILDEDGALVADTGAVMERTIADLVATGALPARAFNASNDGSATADSRSDDKSIEPEGVAIGKVGGRTYAFIALERIGGVMTFDITDPRTPTFVDYVNNRDYTATGAAARDLGAEGIEFVAAEDSPIGEPLVVVANEVSGTTTLFRVDALRR